MSLESLAFHAFGMHCLESLVVDPTAIYVEAVKLLLMNAFLNTSTICKTFLSHLLNALNFGFKEANTKLCKLRL